MNVMLHLFLYQFVLMLFDDILICSSSWSLQPQHIEVVLDTLHNNFFYVRRSKCLFGASLVTYHVHIVSVEGVTMDHDRVGTVTA